MVLTSVASLSYVQQVSRALYTRIQTGKESKQQSSSPLRLVFSSATDDELQERIVQVLVKLTHNARDTKEELLWLILLFFFLLVDPHRFHSERGFLTEGQTQRP
jgi:hypothetical protein